MRYATFSLTTDPTELLGLLSGDTRFDVHALLGPPSGAVPRTLPELIREGQASWARLATNHRSADSRFAGGGEDEPDAAAGTHPSGTRRKHHLPGLNYASHAKERPAAARCDS
jgi:hypothetical protein